MKPNSITQIDNSKHLSISTRSLQTKTRNYTKYNTMANKEQRLADSGSILDAIKEQTSNIEAFTNGQTINATLDEALKEMASSERNVRESTITIKNNEEINNSAVPEIIEKEWVQRREAAPVAYWHDKQNSYAQFIDPANKEVFLKYAQSLNNKEPNNDLHKLYKLITPPNKQGHQLVRKEVRIEIPNVRGNIKTDVIDKLLGRMKAEGAIITPIREGKPHGPAGHQSRSLMIRTNSAGFEILFGKLNGIIPYTKLETATKIRLYPKVNARPWSCRDCYFIGPNHNCAGKACTQCGSHDHQGKDCKAKTRYCTNCKRRGHRAKDAHCPIYIREVAKEVKRMDIPLEYIEDETKRNQLIKTLLIR